MVCVRALLLASLVAAAACSPSSSELGEVAAELRALRLQARSAPPSAADKPQVAEALSPLRTALDGLLATQRDLQSQQVELAREMQRWSQLVGESANAARGEEGRALARRLQELEEKMAQQEARHREVETLLRGALDRTSERLESFLLQLQSVPRAGAVEANGPTEASGANGPAGPAAPSSPPANDPKQGSMDGGRSAMSVVPPSRPGISGTVGWWILLVASLLVGGNLFLRAMRWRGAALPVPRPAGEPARAADAAAPAPAPALQSAEEIWAAAALLGEAVDRLRRGKESAASAPSAAPARHQPGDLDFAGLDEQDLFVVDGLDEPAAAGDVAGQEPGLRPVVVPSPDAPPSPPTVVLPAARDHAGPPRAVASVLPRRAPAQLSFRLRPRDPAHACTALLKILREDPRVLQRPEPRVQGTGPEVVCQFAVLPGLPAGECSVLEQRLRDSVG